MLAGRDTTSCTLTNFVKLVSTHRDVEEALLKVGCISQTNKQVQQSNILPQEFSALSELPTYDEVKDKCLLGEWGMNTR